MASGAAAAAPAPAAEEQTEFTVVLKEILRRITDTLDHRFLLRV
jgi:ribosomal protein L7/L12